MNLYCPHNPMTWPVTLAGALAHFNIYLVRVEVFIAKSLYIFGCNNPASCQKQLAQGVDIFFIRRLFFATLYIPCFDL